MVMDSPEHEKAEFIDRPKRESQSTNVACRSFPTTRRTTYRLPTVGCKKAVVPEETSALMTTTREGGHLKRGQDARLRVGLSQDHNINERREEVLKEKKIGFA